MESLTKDELILILISLVAYKEQAYKASIKPPLELKNIDFDKYKKLVELAEYHKEDVKRLNLLIDKFMDEKNKK